MEAEARFRKDVDVTSWHACDWPICLREGNFR